MSGMTRSLTTESDGKVYFQGLPPNLQNRCFFDPARGTRGGLVMRGEFFNETVGEDYLNLNLLSAQDLTDLKALCPAPDANKARWDAAVAALATRMETFRESPSGTYERAPQLDVAIAAAQRADVPDPDTAVAS